jgi:hypothetical protein
VEQFKAPHELLYPMGREMLRKHNPMVQVAQRKWNNILPPTFQFKCPTCGTRSELGKKQGSSGNYGIGLLRLRNGEGGSRPRLIGHVWFAILVLPKAYFIGSGSVARPKRLGSSRLKF